MNKWGDIRSGAGQASAFFDSTATTSADVDALGVVRRLSDAEQKLLTMGKASGFEIVQDYAKAVTVVGTARTTIRGVLAGQEETAHAGVSLAAGG